MSLSQFNSVTNELHSILRTSTTEDAVEKLMRYASAQDRTTAMLALCSMLMVENARRFHAEARCAELRVELEKSEAAHKKLLESMA